MAITDWPLAERPREKLLIQGAGTLSDAELLAIFLRTGCQGKSAVDLARELLVSFGGLRQLLEADRATFCRGFGLGNAKYTQLQAVLEMSKRHLQAELQVGDLLSSPDLVRSYLTAAMRHLPYEVFTVLYLNTQNSLIAAKELFRGTIDSAQVHPREVVKQTLELNASSVIFAHNHPSGVAEPSMADQAITSRLKKALALIDVRVLDHLVIGNGEVVSFAERGLL